MVDGIDSFVGVDVSSDVQINIVLVKDIFKGELKVQRIGDRDSVLRMTSA